MDAETTLKSTITLLEGVHVPGFDAEKLSMAIKNIKACVRTIEIVTKQAEEEKRKEGAAGED